MVSEKTIAKLTRYQRILIELQRSGVDAIHSHDLAQHSGASAAQVRRDLMTVGYEGTPKRGYGTAGLLKSLQDYLVQPGGQKCALVGIGNIGQALLSYFKDGRFHLSISAAFDIDPHKAGRVICGCRCYSLNELEEVLQKEKIKIAIIAVPAASAQEVADKLVAIGIRSLVNFAPTPVKMPSSVFVENVDLTMALEKAAFFARSPEAASKED